MEGSGKVFLFQLTPSPEISPYSKEHFSVPKKDYRLVSQQHDKFQENVNITQWKDDSPRQVVLETVGGGLYPSLDIDREQAYWNW